MTIYPLYCCITGDYMGFFSSKEMCVEFVKKEIKENEWDKNGTVEVILKGASLKAIDSNNTILLDFFVEEAELDKAL